LNATCNIKAQLVGGEWEQGLSVCHRPELFAQVINILETFFLSLNNPLASSPPQFTAPYSGVQPDGDILIDFRLWFTPLG